MNDCIFCKIVKGEIPSSKVYEDENFLAILDINPNTKGVTLVMPKKHKDSYVFDFDDNFICEFMSVVKVIAKKLELALGVSRVGFILEGMGVNHLHAKLYPFHGLGEEFEEMEHGKEQVFFENYPGYMTSLLGPQADFVELDKLAEKIRDAGV